MHNDYYLLHLARILVGIWLLTLVLIITFVLIG